MDDVSMRCRSRFLPATIVALGLIAGGLVAPTPAGAETLRQFHACNNDGNPTPDEAINGCTAMIRSGKYRGRNLAIAYTNRGSAYDDKHDEDRAIADQDAAIKIDPTLDLAFNNRANAYGRKGDNDRAIADYNEAIRLNPKFAMAYNNRGTTHRDNKDYARAVADYGEAIRINPKFSDAYNNRGIAYDYMGNRDGAIADYTSAIRLNPKFPLPYNNRGLQYRTKGDYDTAVADFNTALAIDPRYANGYRNRGNTWLKKGDYDRAITDLSTALGIRPGDSESLSGRGLAYTKTGDFDRAIADYDGVIADDARDLAALTNRGYVHFYRGDFADATADLSRVVGADLFTYPSLFLYLAQSRAGRPLSDLEAAERRMNSQDWPYAVFELYLGRRDPEAALAAAQNPDQRCEAQFYVGEKFFCTATAPPPSRASRSRRRLPENIRRTYRCAGGAAAVRQVSSVSSTRRHGERPRRVDKTLHHRRVIVFSPDRDHLRLRRVLILQRLEHHAVQPQLRHRTRHQRDAQSAADQPDHRVDLVHLLHDPRAEAVAAEQRAEAILDVLRLRRRRHDESVVPQGRHPDLAAAGRRIAFRHRQHIRLALQQHRAERGVVRHRPHQPHLNPAARQRVDLLAGDHLHEVE